MGPDVIYVNGLRDDVLIGVLPEERLARQPIQVDLEIEADLSSASRSDDIADTVNYGHVADEVRRLMRSSEDLLLERLAGRILDLVLAFPGVQGASVTVTKMRPPIDGEIDSTAVRLRRSAD